MHIFCLHILSVVPIKNERKAVLKIYRAIVHFNANNPTFARISCYQLTHTEFWPTNLTIFGKHPVVCEYWFRFLRQQNMCLREAKHKFSLISDLLFLCSGEKLHNKLLCNSSIFFPAPGYHVCIHSYTSMLLSEH